MNVAIVDLGKTNAKLARVDTLAARELDVLSIPTPVLAGEPYPRPDVEALWRFLLDGLATLRHRGPIDAIGITTHGATVALLDADGALALPVLDYEHAGPDECRDEYAALRPTFAETGSPHLPGGLNVGAQLHWQQKAFPARFARVAHIVTWPQYWAWRLTGELATDLTSLGCHTDLVNPSPGGFSSLAEGRGWDRLMPPVRRSGERLGPVSAEVVARTGLPADTAVHVGIHDSNASLVPHLLARDAPMSVVSTGTWVIAMAVGGAGIELDETRDVLVNIDARGRPVPSARFMGGREHTLLTRHRGAAAADAAAADPAEADAALARVLGRGAMLLPSIVRGSGPWPERTAKWTVPESALDDGEHAIVVAHYLAAMTATCLELVGARGPIAVEGPFAANRRYLEMLAAITARPVQTSENVTGTSVGTAMLIEAPRALAGGRVVSVSGDLRERLARHALAWRERALG